MTEIMANPNIQSVMEKRKEDPCAELPAMFEIHLQEINKFQRIFTELKDNVISMLDSFERMTKNEVDCQNKVKALKKNLVEFLQNNIKDVTASIDFMMARNIERVEENDTLLEENVKILEDTLSEILYFQVESQVETFDPMEVFKLYPFKSMKLTRDMKKFRCKIVGIIDSLHFIVEPINEKFIDKFKMLERKINRYASHMHRIDLKTNEACVARYSEDGRYYRALVRNHNYSKDEVKVIFVDYLNVEVVKRKYVKPCPPLKHLVVRLDGVIPCAGVRQSQIKFCLSEYIDKEAILVIVKNTNGAIPSVQLYDKDNKKELLYQTLIGRYFYDERPDSSETYTTL